MPLEVRKSNIKAWHRYTVQDTLVKEAILFWHRRHSVVLSSVLLLEHSHFEYYGTKRPEAIVSSYKSNHRAEDCEIINAQI